MRELPGALNWPPAWPVQFFPADSPLTQEALDQAMGAQRLKDLQENRQYHATAVQKVIDQQMDPNVAQQMSSGGSGML